MTLKRFIYVLITKAKSKDKVDPQILVQSLEALKARAKMSSIKTVSMLREASELEASNGKMLHKLFKTFLPQKYNSEFIKETN